jgi:hypothetical protein
MYYSVQAVSATVSDGDDGEGAHDGSVAKGLILLLLVSVAVPRSYAGAGAAAAVQILVESPSGCQW